MYGDQKGRPDPVKARQRNNAYNDRIAAPHEAVLKRNEGRQLPVADVLGPFCTPGVVQRTARVNLYQTNVLCLH